MPIDKKYLADLDPDSYFHIYNRTNNHEVLFPTTHNKIYFLKLIERRLLYLIDIYAWCLIPNHFHFLIKTKTPEKAAAYLSHVTCRKLTMTESAFLKGTQTFSSLTLRAWTGVFQSYAEAFNKMHKRKGNLFYTSFKRIKIADESHFIKSLVYIHTNPRKHGLTEDYRDYEWSSWNSYEFAGQPHVKRELVYEMLGGSQVFLQAHEKYSNYVWVEQYPIC